MKRAVILMNLGGPDRQESVRPFLFNLFNDPAIINIIQPFRFFTAKLISIFREKKAKGIYKLMGGGSPILELTELQKKFLEKNLIKKGRYKCFIIMRYWHPRAREVYKEILQYNPKEVILLPLYPQFSTTTTGSSVNEWKNINTNNFKTKTICCYPNNEDFINAHVKSIRKFLNIKLLPKTTLLFSAHGLPQKIIDSGDPYQRQIEETAQKIIEKLKIKNLNFNVCYQSRVGPLKWIGPSTDDEIIRNSKQKLGIVLCPIAFVSEHSETLVELDIEYKHLAKKNGALFYKRVPALGVNKDFIKGLTNLVLNKKNYGTKGLKPPFCDSSFSRCFCKT